MKDQAIAICRVSTSEQKLSNSLNRQDESVRNAASRLGVEIVERWSGDASSKVGKNLKRKDLLEAFEFCKKNRQVKYLIVDEVDRFMRSMGEMFYWMTKFEQEAGVRVHFASNPDLNTDDAKARLLLSLDGFKAEGSNEERQHKSISGHEKAIREGRYTFPPKPGYMKGDSPGVHKPHPLTFEPLQQAFKEVLSGLYTPLDAMKRLNGSNFKQVHATWKMDKFRQFATDPYYAGVLVKDRQVKARNERGLHQPMISREEHEQLVQIFAGKTKFRGPKKQYNPEFPMNKIMVCSDCGGGVKFTGSRKNNGYARKTTKEYFKYHCRGCGKAYHRDEVHGLVTSRLKEVQYTGRQKEELVEALKIVWAQKQKDKLVELKHLRQQIDKLSATKSSLLIEFASADPSLKDDLKGEIENIKTQIASTEGQIDKLGTLEEDLAGFLQFGLNYTDELADDWWALNHEDRVQCQLLIFPGGISFNSQKKVGTTQISPIYGLKPNKKDLSMSEKSLMVELADTASASDW
jgi:DNA invertase Pin-like site-specific DNA recombinase